MSRVGIVLVTGDRGLAGAFNTNIIREGVRLKREFAGERRRGPASRSSAGAATRP